MIPYSCQTISEKDIEAVVSVLRSNFLTQGPTTINFEQAVADYCGAKYSISTNSATSALHIACLALNLNKGDWLWTSPNSFVASANCAIYCGANVDFVDIDARTYNMSVDCLKKKLIKAKKEQKLPKIIVVVHYAGQPCDMPSIHNLSNEYGFKVIEDASHAIGSSYLNVKVGSCIHSDITVFSFHPVKNITTGEGGIAVTNDEKIAHDMKCLRTHGIVNQSGLMEKKPDDEIWNYQQISLGFNYRMTEIQAALGMSQLSQLDEFIIKRRRIAEIYNQKLTTLPIKLPWQGPSTYSSYHLYPICINNKSSKYTQKEIFTLMRNNDIGVNIHYIPIYLHPYYKKLGFEKGYCPNAEDFFKSEISIPIYPTLSEENQNKVIELLKIIFKHKTFDNTVSNI